MNKLLFVWFFVAVELFALTPSAYQKSLGIGINVNWCNFKKYVDREYYKSGSELFSTLGFKHVRIRFNGGLYKADKTKMLNALKNAVDASLEHNLIPVITYIDDDLAKNPNNKNIQDAVEAWSAIAKIFQGYLDTVSYDLYIEPNHKFGKKIKKMLRFYKASIKAIRAVDREKILFIAPSHIANPYYLDELLPIVQNKNLNHNLMIEWHFYASGPSKTNKKKLWSSGSDYEKALITKKVAYAHAWCKKHKLYSWMGAMMPGDYNHANSYTPQEEVAFVEYLLKTLKSYGIPAAVNAGQQFYDYKTDKLKREQVLRAILRY
jgi:hypothetical protein